MRRIRDTEETELKRQNEVIQFLNTKSAYAHDVERIKMIETHISWIFLTGRYTYKAKKALRFGKILDFSTLYLRKKYCKKEVDLNRFLCGNMYQGVIKVVRSNGKGGHLK